MKNQNKTKSTLRDESKNNKKKLNNQRKEQNRKQNDDIMWSSADIFFNFISAEYSKRNSSDPFQQLKIYGWKKPLFEKIKTFQSKNNVERQAKQSIIAGNENHNDQKKNSLYLLTFASNSNVQLAFEANRRSSLFYIPRHRLASEQQ